MTASEKHRRDLALLLLSYLGMAPTERARREGVDVVGYLADTPLVRELEVHVHEVANEVRAVLLRRGQLPGN